LGQIGIAFWMGNEKDLKKSPSAYMIQFSLKDSFVSGMITNPPAI
jgi:hypothetical protein